MADFGGVHRRTSWAEYHFQCLEKEATAYLESGAIHIDTEIQDNGSRLYRAHLPEPPPVELALRAADVIHHLRAALDNAVWELHPAGTRRTQFPVASSEQDWNNVQSQVAGLTDEVIATIRNLQPFVQGGLGQDLVQLNDLAARDRHRFPQVLFGATLAAGLAAWDLPHDAPMPNIELSTLEHGTVVGTWPKAGYWADKEFPAVTFDIHLQFGPDTPAPARIVRVALAAYQGVVDRAIGELAAFA